MATRQTNFRALVGQVDPNFSYSSRIVPEYEFTSVGARPQNGRSRDKSETFDRGTRVFMGDYQNRGPYGS